MATGMSVVQHNFLISFGTQMTFKFLIIHKTSGALLVVRLMMIRRNNLVLLQTVHTLVCLT